MNFVYREHKENSSLMNELLKGETTMNEDSFKENDMLEFAKFYNEARVSWAALHKCMAAPEPIELLFKKFKQSKQNSFTIKADKDFHRTSTPMEDKDVVCPPHKIKADKDSSGVSEKDWEIVGMDYITEGSEKQITSVKRLSDNLIVELHKTKVVDPNTKHEWIVSEIYEKDNKIWLNGVWLNHVAKAKQPLFKTEDGKEIFDGDSIWTVRSDNDWGIHEWVDVNKYSCKEDWKYFSTEAAAKEYIIHKKQTLSLDDILSCKYPYPTFNFIAGGKDYKILDEQKLRELVEKRINAKM